MAHISFPFWLSRNHHSFSLCHTNQIESYFPINSPSLTIQPRPPWVQSHGAEICGIVLHRWKILPS